MSYQMSCDIGGTFTDLIVRTDDGSTQAFKSSTTPDDLSRGLFDAFEKAAAAYELTLEELLDNTARVVHGTTVATNAILEDNLPETALLCTEGFRDVLTLREGGKEDPYDPHVPYPDPYVPRKHTFGVTERIDATGTIETELDEAQCRSVLQEIRGLDIDAVAVSLLWSHTNPEHEQQIADLLEEELPEVSYSLSSDVCPIIREYRRTSATAINASLQTVVDAYLDQLSERFNTYGYDGQLFVMTANGGVMNVEEVRRFPIWIVDAGPTMLPTAAQKVVRAEAAPSNVLALDMGGTSLDMGLITEGDISRSREATVGNDYMLGIEKVEINSVGSGGGSIAWVDSGGLLHVGPESAGATPGPACYGRGGTRPTVTDAALVLGYLNEAYFLGGTMDLDLEMAREAIDEHVATPLDIDVPDAAHAIYVTANQDMVNGIKKNTIEHGIDPRNYVICGGGGAIGMHIAAIARELRIDDIYLPADAGVISSLGGLHSEIRRDFSESYYTDTENFDKGGVEETLSNLDQQVTAFFDRAEISEVNRSVSYVVEARYPNQIWELEIPVPDRESLNVSTLLSTFHDTHESVYGYMMDDQPIEFLNWRAQATVADGSHADAATTTAGGSASASTGATTPSSNRPAFFGEAYQDTPAYLADELGRGASIDGPAFVDAPETTIVVPPRSSLTVTPNGNYRLSLQNERGH